MRAVIFGYFGTLTDPGAEEYREPLAQDGKDVDQLHRHAFPTRTSRHASHRQHDAGPKGFPGSHGGEPPSRAAPDHM